MPFRHHASWVPSSDEHVKQTKPATAIAAIDNHPPRMFQTIRRSTQL
jgi:hypothetical protein